MVVEPESPQSRLEWCRGPQPKDTHGSLSAAINTQTPVSPQRWLQRRRFEAWKRVVPQRRQGSALKQTLLSGIRELFYPGRLLQGLFCSHTAVFVFHIRNYVPHRRAHAGPTTGSFCPMASFLSWSRSVRIRVLSPTETVLHVTRSHLWPSSRHSWAILSPGPHSAGCLAEAGLQLLPTPPGPWPAAA